MDNVREALALLLRNFPTDTDMHKAGWSATDINAACEAYDNARAALAQAVPSADEVKRIVDDCCFLYAPEAQAKRKRIHAAIDALAAPADVPSAMKVVTDAMRADPGYAWSWHCNIAMAYVDASGDRTIGNQGAERFMRLLANVEPAHPETYERQAVAPEPVAPGWVLVPETPTLPMLVDGAKALLDHGREREAARTSAIYKAMLAAVPTPKAQREG